MEISVSDAKAQLTDLVRRAENGENIVLTRHGKPVVRLVVDSIVPDSTARRAILERLRKLAPAARPGADAARSQDFLYDDAGLPK